MIRIWRYWLFTAAAALAVVLVVANFVVAEGNRATQMDVASRQAFINQSAQLSQVNQALVRAIAVAAVKDQDQKLGKILASQGITVQSSPAVAAGAAAAPGAAQINSGRSSP